MSCPNCSCFDCRNPPVAYKTTGSVVAEYSFWLRTGGPMMYNVECIVCKDGKGFIASTSFFGLDHYTAKIIGKGNTEEAAVKDLRTKLGHKPSTDE